MKSHFADLRAQEVRGIIETYRLRYCVAVIKLIKIFNSWKKCRALSLIMTLNFVLMLQEIILVIR